MNKVIIGIIVLIVIGGGIYLASQASKPEEKMMDKTSEASNKAVMEDKEATGSMEKKDGAIMEGYKGQVLAGKSSPLLDFNKQDYDEVLKSDKLVVLYFYANWCPICKAEFPKAMEAFDEITSDKVIGFRVNYNDSDTDKDEVVLAKEHGVAYQHTKVIIKNGKRILKSPETWDKQRYLEEINKVL